MTGIAAPLAVTQLSQLVMNLAASFMLGRISGSALAAGGLCAIFIQALTVVSQGLIAGAHPLMAAARGRSEAAGAEDDGAAYAFGGAVLTALICSVVAVGFLLNLPSVLAAFPLEPQVLHDLGLFIRHAAWALPAILWIAPIRFYFSVSGRSWLVMAGIGLGAVFYVFLLYALTFGVAGLPAHGIEGAGTAFAVAWWAIALGLTSYAIWRGHLPLRMLAKAYPTAPRSIRDVWAVGWPIALIYAAELGLTLAMTLLASSFGTIAIVANQITNTMNSIAFNPIVALGQAATVRVAYQSGAGRPVEARLAGNLALIAAGTIMAIFGVVLLIGSDHIVLLFLDAAAPDYAAIEALTRTLILILVAFVVFDGIQAAANGSLRGVKDTRIPMLIGLCGYWLVGMPTAVILAFAFGFGAIGIWCGILTGITIVACMLFWRWRRLMQPHRRSDIGVPSAESVGSLLRSPNSTS